MTWSHERVMDTIREDGIIAVVRTPTADLARSLIDAYLAGGLRLIEVTLTTPDALDVLRDLSGSDEACYGAGTVMDRSAAEAVIEAGGNFVISPHTDPETIDLCRERSTVVIPGSLTPSEVARAWKCRPDFVKVFPIGPMGAGRYLRAVRGPLPDVPIIPTGGVTLENVEDLFRAGARAVGVSDGLHSAEDIQEGRWSVITERAREFLAKIKAIR